MHLKTAGTRIAVGVALVASLLVVDGQGQGEAAQAAPAPRVSDPAAAARSYLAEHAAEHGLTASDVRDLRVSSVVPSDGLGTIVYLQQTVAGIDVTESIVNVLVDADGAVQHVASSAVTDAAARVSADTVVLSDVQAARSAARALDLDVDGRLASKDRAKGADRARELGDGGISADRIPANLVYQRTAADRLRLAWQLEIDPEDADHLWQVRIDAATGRELERHDWVSHAGDSETYEAYPLPVEAPSFGARALLTDPADELASPYGWLDTDGVPGADTTVTNGNNVHAYTDTNNDNLPDPDSEADGGSDLTFSFQLDLAQSPTTYRTAAVTNLFYVTNRVHDVLYGYGFTEEAGNFQTSNYGRGGVDGDAVRAEASDGGGLNNANFATPPDGQAPRMQMYLWNQSTPWRDGSLDAGIIAHEYGHGVSNRLTGGPSTTSCLGNGEQPGEGWSDFLSLVLTTPLGTVGEPATGRAMGTYAMGQGPAGDGIRSERYSRDPAINTMHYGDIADAFHPTTGAVLPHDVGEVWGQMLWQLTWDLVDEYGYSDDLETGTGGNNRALQLVMDGLKLQPCAPGFVDARDAILAADEIRYGGADECLIWRSFAADGLGYSARQGSSSLIDDGTEAYDLPPQCAGLTLSSSTSPAQPVAGESLTHHLTLSNVSGGPLTGAEATARLDADATYVAGSATCGGTYDAGSRTVTFEPGDLAAGESVDCSYEVSVADVASTIAFTDDFESGLSAWTVSHDLHPTGPPENVHVSADWALVSDAGPDGGTAVHAAEPAAPTDQWLTKAAPVRVRAGASTLAFDQRLGTEVADDSYAYDGGQVLVSSDGGATWAQPPFTVGGPEHTMATFSGADAVYNTPVAGEPVIAGGTDGWVRATADLSAYAGQSVRLAFRMVSDTAVGGSGWWVDNVAVGDLHDLDQEVTFAADGLGPWTTTSTARIVAATPPPPPVDTRRAPAAPVVTGSTLESPSSVLVAFAPGDDGGAPVTSYDVRCTSAEGGAEVSASGPASPVTVSGLSVGRSYRCAVRATNVVGTSDWSPAGPTVVAASAPAAPTVADSTVVSRSSIQVAFAAGGDGGAPVTAYDVRCVSPDGGTEVSATGPASPVTVTGLSVGRSYRCEVRASNAVGTGEWSEPGATVIAAVAPAPPRVTKPKVKGRSVTVRLALADHGGSAVTRYDVTCVPTAKGRTRSASGTTPTLTVRRLSLGRAYRCQATATTVVGTSPTGPWSERIRVRRRG